MPTQTIYLQRSEDAVIDELLISFDESRAHARKLPPKSDGAPHHEVADVAIFDFRAVADLDVAAGRVQAYRAAHGTLPLFVIGERAQERDLLRATKLGLRDFISTPVTFNELAAAMVRGLKSTTGGPTPHWIRRSELIRLLVDYTRSPRRFLALPERLYPAAADDPTSPRPTEMGFTEPGIPIGTAPPLPRSSADLTATEPAGDVAQLEALKQQREALQQREQQLQDAEAKVAASLAALRETEERLARQEAAMVQSVAELAERERALAAQQSQSAMVRDEVDGHSVELERAQRALEEEQATLAQQRAELEQARQEHAAAAAQLAASQLQLAAAEEAAATRLADLDQRVQRQFRRLRTGPRAIAAPVHDREDHLHRCLHRRHGGHRDRGGDGRIRGYARPADRFQRPSPGSLATL